MLKADLMQQDGEDTVEENKKLDAVEVGLDKNLVEITAAEAKLAKDEDVQRLDTGGLIQDAKALLGKFNIAE